MLVGGEDSAPRHPGYCDVRASGIPEARKKRHIFCLAVDGSDGGGGGGGGGGGRSERADEKNAEGRKKQSGGHASQVQNPPGRGPSCGSPRHWNYVALLRSSVASTASGILKREYL